MWVVETQLDSLNKHGLSSVESLVEKHIKHPVVGLISLHYMNIHDYGWARNNWTVNLQLKWENSSGKSQE